MIAQYGTPTAGNGRGGPELHPPYQWLSCLQLCWGSPPTRGGARCGKLSTGGDDHRCYSPARATPMSSPFATGAVNKPRHSFTGGGTARSPAARFLSPVAPLETWREALTSMVIFGAAVTARRDVSIAGYPLAAAFDLHGSA